MLILRQVTVYLWQITYGNCLANKISTRMLWFIYSYGCGLSAATIECSSVCVCVCVSVCLCVCKQDNSKNNQSINLKFEYIVAYENSLDKFDIGHCPIKVKVTA